jgi:hypothetical protein
MDDSPEVIRHQMEETRAALSDKLETLEQQVVDTVHEARVAVTETVTNVKDAVHDTVESVKETFDIQRQMQHHPWAILGGSIALGFIGARLFDSLASQAPAHNGSNGHNGVNGMDYRHQASAPMPVSAPPESNGEHSLFGSFEPEIHRLKGLAVGAALGVFREMISGSIPEPLKPQVAEIMNGITVKLGGEPVRGDLLKTV